jgi:ubiquinone/menaquinone biosynthesis C-methylase UbiE
MQQSDATDKWAAWVLHRRHGDDPEQRAKAMEHLGPIRDRVLDNAGIAKGDTVLDVGAGDGLIAFAALDHVGPDGHVIASDVSADLVAHTRTVAHELGVADRMSFVEARAEDLAAIRDASVDVVTLRSVLIYVDDKASAFEAFHRVLRAGGCLSIFEPINNYFPESDEEFWGFDARPISDLIRTVWDYDDWSESVWENDPMMNFTEKDLLRFAEDAGFGETHAELFVDVEPGSWVVDWERLLETSPNPNANTVRESLEGALTHDEVVRFEDHLRPLVDAGKATKRAAFAYLFASK